MKYSSLMNVHNLEKALQRIPVEFHQDFFSLQCQVTEKIHGENFRVGVNEDGTPLIGQRNTTYPSLEAHPAFHKLNEEGKQQIEKLLWRAQEVYQVTGNVYVYFGELCGNGMQKGFVYPWTGLKVLFFDITKNGRYMDPEQALDLLQRVLEVGTVPVYHERLSLREALKLDIENMKPLASQADHIEGVVIKPIVEDLPYWHLMDRPVIKFKTTAFSEKKPSGALRLDNNSTAYQFVTPARLDHVIQQLVESGVPIEKHMKDMQFIAPKIVEDVKKEEFTDTEFTKDDQRVVTKEAARLYLSMLNENLKQLFN